MIKIQDHLNRGDADDYIEELVTSHWNYLVDKKLDGSYGKTSLITSCLAAKLNCSTLSYLKDYAENIPERAERHLKFFEFLLSNDFEKLQEIIIGDPTKLAFLRDEIYTILEESDIFTVSNGIVKQTKFGKYLSNKIFRYSAYRKSRQCINTLKALGFTSATCPYCNYTRLDVIGTHKKKIAYLELDHFFLKAKHPFFSVSFYNLIPSCHSCNSTDKGVIPFSLQTHINPFHESFDKIYKFSFSASFFHGSTDEFQIQNIGSKETDQTALTFKLQEKYKNRISEFRNLVNQFNKFRHKLGTPDENFFIEMLMENIPMSQSDILRYERAKAKRDLLKELDSTNALQLR